jgi:hypothetical protein
MENLTERSRKSGLMKEWSTLIEKKDTGEHGWKDVDMNSHEQQEI